MRKLAVLFTALSLCILAIPAIAGDDNEGEEGSTRFEFFRFKLHRPDLIDNHLATV